MANRHKSAKSVFISALFLLLLLFLNTKDASASTCRLSLSSGSLSFTATPGGANPSSQSFNVLNVGGTAMYWWDITSLPSWLSLSPRNTVANGCNQSGPIGGGSTSVSVSVNISGLSAGTYSQSITISAGNTGCSFANNLHGNQSITINLTVAETPLPPLPSVGAGGPASPVPGAPTASTGKALSASSIRWNFKDNADNETGFRIFDLISNLPVISFNDINLSYLDETGLKSNTKYSNRYAQAFNANYVSQLSNKYEPVYTLIESPKTLILQSRTKDSISVAVQERLSNLYSGQSGVFFEAADSDGNVLQSGWLRAPSYTATSLKTGVTYNFRVKARNGDGIETSFSKYFNFIPQQVAVPTVPAPLSGVLPAIPAVPTKPAVSAFTRNLTVGSTGDDVVTLQKFLEEKGFLVMPKGVAKGFFGRLTRDALAKYQASVGISPAVGFFGPITRAKLNELLSK